MAPTSAAPDNAVAPPIALPHRALGRARLLAAAIVLTQLVVAALLLAALTHPATPPLDVGSAGDERFLSNFYRVETDGGLSYRWSGPDARIVLHGTTGMPHELRLRMFVPPPPARAPNDRVQLARDGVVLADWTPATGWRTYHIVLPAGATTGRRLEAAPLALVTPLHRPGPGDQRDLGVALDWLQAQPLDGHVPPADPSVLRALLLACSFALVTLLAWRADRTITRARGDIGSLARTLAASIVGGAALVLWARTAPSMLAWALPATPWLVGLLAFAAAGPPLVQRGRASRVPPSAARWVGLGLLLVAQALLWTQAAVLPGALLAVAAG